MESSEEFVIVKKKEYDTMKKKLLFLEALQAAGVDNWSGYSYAYEILESWEGTDGDPD